MDVEQPDGWMNVLSWGINLGRPKHYTQASDLYTVGSL